MLDIVECLRGTRPGLLDEIEELKTRLAALEYQLRYHYTDEERPDLSTDEERPDLSKCPSCGGPADNGHDREYPPNVYACSKCSQKLYRQGIMFADD